ncbi:MAG TPA: CooT family nickel-binding protein [Desulfobulbus sp.]|nr:CooT family nickel-binding protein [Desulfobulbus sp.]
MCQISAVVERDGVQETVMESVTALEVVEDGVILSTFFEEPKKISDVVIDTIDFLGGAVVMKPALKGSGA